MIDCSILPRLDGEEETANAPVLPGYVRIYDILFGLIEDGTLKPGESIPGENILASHFGVSRGTVRTALRRLKEDGYIYKLQGKKTTVTETAGREKYGLQRLYNPCIENCIESVEEIKCKIVFQPCGRYVAKVMGCEIDGFMTVAAYLSYYVENQMIATTICICSTSFLEDKKIYCSDKHAIEELALGGIYKYARRSDMAINIVGRDEQKKDDVPEGESIIIMEEVLKTEENRAAAYMKHRLNSDWYRFFLERRLAN